MKIERHICLCISLSSVVFENGLVAALGKDYYKILGVSKTANEKQIKKAFRKLAIQFHPDKNKDPDAEEKFREIAEAHDVLSDTTKRQKYDRFGADGLHDQPGFEGGAFKFDFGDFFKDFGGFGRRQEGNGGGRKSRFSMFDDDDDDFFGGGFGGFDGMFGGGRGGGAFDDEDQGFGGGFGDGFDDLASRFGGGGFGFGGGDNGFEQPATKYSKSAQMKSQTKMHKKGGKSCTTVTKKVGNMVMTTTQCS